LGSDNTFAQQRWSLNRLELRLEALDAHLIYRKSSRRYVKFTTF